MIISRNPYLEEIINKYDEHSWIEVKEILIYCAEAQIDWRKTSFQHRAEHFFRLAEHLIEQCQHYARIITAEMGKPIKESIAEVEKCAWVCRFYAENAESFLQKEIIESDASDSYLLYQPLGVILAVMPWNFPFWQVFRFAAPALMAGNGAVLKHASNVTGCALAIENIFKEAGFPDDIFRTLVISSSTVERVIRDETVAAVTLTGSETAGGSVAAVAGKAIKKSVLELGGSDPFIVLNDAEIEDCINTAVTARMLNTGQSCIAAKRFIVEKGIVDKFTQSIIKKIKRLKMGDPMKEQTEIGPLARADLVEQLHYQVKESQMQGACIATGGKRTEGKGYFYEPTVMTDVTSDMTVFREETFGPVLTIIEAQDVEDALILANDTEFGLGASVWTSDMDKARYLAGEIEAGGVFINGMVKSDPRLPFGGIKKSGFGRELSYLGIREFVNIKTVWFK